MARRERDANESQSGSGNAGNDSSEQRPIQREVIQHYRDTSIDHPASQEITQPHYTISEDEIGKGVGSNFAALALKMAGPGQTEPSEPSKPSAGSFSIPRAYYEKKQEPADLRPPQVEAPFPTASASHAASQRNTHSHGPSSAVQRWKQLDKPRWNSGETPETQNRIQNHDYRYSPADSSGARVEIGEAYPEQSLSSGVDVNTSSLYSSHDVQISTTKTNENPDQVFPELLGAEGTSVCFDILQKMQQRIQQLEIANEELRRASMAPLGVMVQIFYCLVNEEAEEKTYLAEPEWLVNGDDIRLSARFLLLDPTKYIEKEKDISFVVYKCYSEDQQRDVVEEAKKFSGPLPNPEPAYQDILLTSKEMVEALSAFFALHPASRQEFPKVNTNDRLSAPFIWWYHHRKSSKIESLPRRQAELVNALVNHIEQAYALLYDNIDDQLSRGCVSNDSMEYLFRPGQVLISFKDGVPQGHIAMSRPFPHAISKRRQDPSEKYFSQWYISSRSISYRGKFVRVEKKLKIEFETETEDGEVDISSLPVMPLEYTSQAEHKRLIRRGQTFWKCRGKRLISYQGGGQIHTGERFMIDYDTYTSLHSKNSYSMNATEEVTETGLPTDGSEPRAPEIYLFPNLVPGFDLRRPLLVDVEVDQIRDVAWNQHAFESLVADRDMKSIILALVTNQIDAKRGTDVIDNKGNGLIMLLHGSPGTGKTFTAESVAEIAKKPLYSVTCGDIGTNPAEVEKYLESVFHLGKIWDCVVLLDEAEVFLEQRTLQDLQRNALVSVFLRALEYYDGILILTTNRVGTFDEAFKSRIQLALRYEKLEAHQRKQIWKNFFERLKSIGEDDSIDFDDISLHIDDLTRYPMNGRQIRNTITTARQLAKFMEEKMSFLHLQRTIAITKKFDQYLADVREADVEEHGGRGLDGRYSDEYFARSDQIR
ncbi:AAA family ATPase [Colletotrichum kahawae]|uniref:AAA family ATPase n=1 Tax=Colletotrichum kahawae TaxID=34407 RepID=A0AAE0CYG2_COLKA|nr:AAA family ATPase [Colletotrichum kahawae]